MKWVKLKHIWLLDFVNLKRNATLNIDFILVVRYFDIPQPPICTHYDKEMMQFCQLFSSHVYPRCIDYDRCKRRLTERNSIFSDSKYLTLV